MSDNEQKTLKYRLRRGQYLRILRDMDVRPPITRYWVLLVASTVFALLFAYGVFGGQASIEVTREYVIDVILLIVFIMLAAYALRKVYKREVSDYYFDIDASAGDLPLNWTRNWLLPKTLNVSLHLADDKLIVKKAVAGSHIYVRHDVILGKSVLGNNCESRVTSDHKYYVLCERPTDIYQSWYSKIIASSSMIDKWFVRGKQFIVGPIVVIPLNELTGQAIALRIEGMLNGGGKQRLQLIMNSINGRQ